MDFDVYVAARRGRLVERAMELGSPEELAAEHVDRVLAEQRKRIRRSADPDPIVQDALDTALSGRPAPRDKRRPVVVAAVGAGALVAAIAVTYEPPTSPVPSLFGYDAVAAESLLEDQGYDVVLETSQVCEPVGQVLGSWPRAGEPVREGARVTVYTAVPAGFFCAAHYLDRQDAWEFVKFALGGPAPTFTDTVHVVVDGSEPAELTGGNAERQARWGGTLRMVVDAARATAETGTRMPELTVTSGTPPRVTCGVPRPAVAGRRPVLRLQIDPRRYGDESGCPLTIDLYRVDRVIDSVVFYTGRT
jgi:hypothetical protein